jgi:hypothetical protein
MGLGWQRKLPTWRCMECYTTHDAYPSQWQHSTFSVFISIPLANLIIQFRLLYSVAGTSMHHGGYVITVAL